jgi:hypothetical protein
MSTVTVRVVAVADTNTVQMHVDDKGLRRVSRGRRRHAAGTASLPSTVGSDQADAHQYHRLLQQQGGSIHREGGTERKGGREEPQVPIPLTREP